MQYLQAYLCKKCMLRGYVIFTEEEKTASVVIKIIGDHKSKSKMCDAEFKNFDILDYTPINS